MNGSKASLGFSVLNLTDKLVRGRIVARASFLGVNGDAVTAYSHPELRSLPAEGESLPDGIGLAFATRRQVGKAITLESNTPDSTLTALELMIVDDAGAIKAVFQFP